MTKLVTVVGNTGVGKTTLVRSLCSNGNFLSGLETHGERPFQALFKNDPKYAFANQVDYMLLRAVQESLIRKSELVGIQDGGLELDFYIFTRLFRIKGYLSDAEYSLCERLYTQIRSAQPGPELIIWMKAPIDVASARLGRRDRPIEIAGPGDLSTIESLLHDWLDGIDPDRVIHLDASKEDVTYREHIPYLLERINKT